MGAEDAKSVYKLGLKYDTSIMVWVENKLFACRLDERAKRYGEQAKTPAVLLENIDEVMKNGVTKILWYDNVDTINRYVGEVGALLNDSINYHTSKPFFLEFVDKKASKAIALQRIGEHYNISREETIAVGDGFNDLSMIEYAGLGVAMGNAPDAIRQKADYVTLTNDEDGLAYVIRKFILNSV
jgi:hypothetical protein